MSFGFISLDAKSIGGVLICLGIVFTAFGFVNVDLKNTTPMPLTELNSSNIEEDIIIEGDLNYNLGAFEESYTKLNGVEVSSTFKYVIPLDDDGYIGLQSYEDIKEFDVQASETFKQWSGESDSSPRTIHIKGQVAKLPRKSLKYFKSYMADMGMTSEEIDKYVYPYFIAVEDYNKWSKLTIIGPIMVIVGAVILLFISIITKKRKAKNKKPSISKIIKNVEQREEELEIYDFCYGDDQQLKEDFVE